MEQIDELPEVELARNELLGGVYAELLAGGPDHPGVVGLAASDCWDLIRTQPWKVRSEVMTMNALSAARFFLSPEGQGMILLAGLGHDGVREGIRLANAVVSRLRIPVHVLMDIPHGAFERAMSSDYPRFTAIPEIERLFARRQEQFHFEAA